MNIIRPAKLFLGFSTILTLVSIVLIVTPGLKMSLDFTGGTLMEITMPEGKTKSDVSAALNTFEADPELGNVSLSTTRGGTVLLRMRDLSNEEHLVLLSHLETALGTIEEQQFTTIGPTVGADLKKNAIWALGLASVAMVLYIAAAFRKVPRRLSPWKFGIIAAIAMLHDVLVTTGIFVILSQVTSFEFDTLFVTALLTIIGYSVNDTIVIFDRIRENLFLLEHREPFEETANRSLNESMTRCLNTTGTTLFSLIALFLLGSESIRWFVLALIVGTSFGAYSSICVATPLLILWRSKQAA